MRRLVIIVAAILTFAACQASAPDQRSQAPTIASAYTVLNIKDISMWTLEKNSKPSRKRLDVSIMAPTAKSFETRGQTVIAACKTIQTDNGADVVRVWLEPNDNTRGLGFVLAMATYSPDGKGMSGFESGTIWDNVRSTDYQIGAHALEMTNQTSLGDISMEQAQIISSRRPYTPR